jgi:hypothetical protein
MVIDPGSIAIGALTCLLVEKAYNKIFGEGSSSQDVYSGSAGVAVSKGFMAKNHVNITEIKQEVKQVSTSNSSSFYSLKN